MFGTIPVKLMRLVTYDQGYVQEVGYTGVCCNHERGNRGQDLLRDGFVAAGKDRCNTKKGISRSPGEGPRHVDYCEQWQEASHQFPWFIGSMCAYGGSGI